MHLWEFVHSPSSVREHWRWRQKGHAHVVLHESLSFSLFLNCLADARENGFDVAAHDFQVVAEPDAALSRFR